MPVEFGFDLQLLPGELREDALTFYRKAVEALSPEFSTVWFNDHFQFGNRPVLESWTTMSFLAAIAPNLRVGNFVLGQGYRNPALLAKMGATLQYLTGGRYVLGIGAGWHEEEFRAYGYGFPGSGTRLAQLKEALEIIRGLWTGGPVTYQGKYYRVEDAYCLPRPDPMIPIMVGTVGPKTLRLVAQRADAWNADGDVESYRSARELLHRYCDEIARDVGDIKLTAGVSAFFPEDPADFVPASPGDTPVLGPTPARAIEQLIPLIDLGVSHVQVRMTDMRTIERFGAEVAPTLT